MMIKTHATYKAHENTFVLLPARSIHYETIAIEKNQRVHIQQTPLEIIENTCLEYWSTYEEQRKVITYHMNFIQKVPIPICIDRGIYFFPTHSPKSLENCWISFPNILKFKDTSTNKPQTTIKFIDGQSIELNVSTHTITSQMVRTLMIKNQLENRKNA